MNTWSNVYFGIFFSVFPFLIVALSFDFDKKYYNQKSALKLLNSRLYSAFVNILILWVFFFYLHCTVHPEHKQNLETKEQLDQSHAGAHTKSQKRTQTPKHLKTKPLSDARPSEH